PLGSAHHLEECGLLTTDHVRAITSSCPRCPASADNRSAASGSLGGETETRMMRGEDTAMRPKQLWWSGLVAAILSGLVGVTMVAAAGDVGRLEGLGGAWLFPCSPC